MSLRPANLPFRRDNLVLAACVLLSITLLVLPGDVRTFVADRLGLVLTGPYWRVRNFGEDVILTRDENAWLKQRVAQLELRAASGQRMQRDAARLAGPALDPGYAGELVPCRVVMRQRGRFATMIKIESLVDMRWEPWLPVISGSGYLGRLRTVINEREAWVELMSAPGFAVGVEFERTGLLGVLRPRGDRFVVEMVGRDEDVRGGDRLITSGIAEIREGAGEEPSADTPRGFPVGTVADVDAPSDQIFKAITVAPSASLDYNETVFVMVPLGSATEGTP